MQISALDRFAWIRPWQKITVAHRDAYELELRTELCPQHPLYKVKATAIARTCNGDDILFYLPGHHYPLAVVHLTFTGRLEPNPLWPTVRFYESLEAWVENCMKPEVVDFERRHFKRTA